MRIEVVTGLDAPTKDKGDLLESLVADLLKAQSYEVTEQVRLTACELDLLCKHTVSSKTVYVECKAHRDNLSADALTKLLGIVSLKGYEEGWLISAGPLGKDAKGFVAEWEQKPQAERCKLAIYTPERVIEALKNASAITAPPSKRAEQRLGSGSRVGDWTLLVSPWGNFWACPCLSYGIPVGVLVFDSRESKLIEDQQLLARLSGTDASLSSLGFAYLLAKEDSPGERTLKPSVVEVEYGECWTDYRPARPEHFVGRVKIQKALLQFLATAKTRRTDTRVFAIKGDSGIGKSSLIAKLRDRADKSKKPSKIFVFAVDVRAASSPGYIYASLLAALRQAGERGFGPGQSCELRVTNVWDPLKSESIEQFLSECERKKELLVLVFDQFEELYSKPELFSVFEEARRLMFSAISVGTSLVLGFAWKTDSTVPQDHPAYYMWHQFADHRLEVELSPFSHADAENSLRLFEKELRSRIRPELRKYIIEQSQGYPWLLKKLCIHLFEQLRAGVSQSELADRSLDISYLFDKDLSSLTPAEDACLKLIAKNVPIDWYEVLETTGAEVVRSLQDKRLVIRRGDKLNLYWDIFREYVLTRSIPHIPFTHVPQSPSISAFMKVASMLDSIEPRSIDELSQACGFSANTIGNILRDLSEFGIVSEQGDRIVLDDHIHDASPGTILGHVRLVLRRHALTEVLGRKKATTPVTQDNLMEFLKQLNPAAKHHSRTWRTYANRMGQWLTIAGYLKETGSQWTYEDAGEVRTDLSRFFAGKTAKSRRIVFIGDAPPGRVVEALEYIKQHGSQSITKMKSFGYRNACAVLYRFGLLEITPDRHYRVPDSRLAVGSSLNSVWQQANEEGTIKQVVQFLRENPTSPATSIGRFVAQIHTRDWTPATFRRVGNSLRQWAGWLLQGDEEETIPEPPGRRSLEKDKTQLPLFSER